MVLLVIYFADRHHRHPVSHTRQGWEVREFRNKKKRNWRKKKHKENGQLLSSHTDTHMPFIHSINFVLHTGT